MRKYIALFGLFALLIGACTKPESNEDELKKVVMEAFIFAGEPVDDIRLTELLPFGGEDTVADPINDADVRIIWRNQTFTLSNEGDSGVYHYAGTDLQINEGELYKIEVDYFGKTASAFTIVPPPTEGLTITRDTMEVFSFESLIDDPFGIDLTPTDPIIAEWANPANEYFYIVIQNTDPNAKPRFEGFEDIFDIIDFFIFSEPTQENSYEITDIDISHLGDHEIKVYRVNQEYVDLFTNLDQDSRTLNEPITNVDNGLGVFSAFNSAVVNFEVVSK
ncbi:MAG: DUF4249 domain-containing protein [Flavobacteriales bacterium]|nr:DUF4249 domain-containing protein [Flavobacteriales bacterium]